MLAFIFRTNKPKSYIASFEAILLHIASKHRLQCARECIHIDGHYQYAFILKVLDSKLSLESNAQEAHNPANQATLQATSHQATCDNFSTRTLDFADELSSSLPVSMYMIFDKIVPDYVPAKRPRFSYAKDPYATTQFRSKRIAMVSDTLNLLQSFEKQDSSFVRLCRQFFSHIHSRHTSQHSSASATIAPRGLYACLDSLASLLPTRPIIIDTARGSYELSSSPRESTMLMFWEMGALQSFMRIDSTQLSCLASVEKPSMKLCPKDIFRDVLLHNGVEIECLLAFDPMLMLLGSLARAKGIEYVFIRKSRALADLSYTSLYAVPQLELITCGRDGIYLNNRKTKHDLFAIIAKHYPQPQHTSSSPGTSISHHKQGLNAHLMLVCYLSMRYSSAIWVYDGTSYKDALPIRFTSDKSHLLSALAHNYQGADRLLANYQAHFGVFSPNPLESFPPLESTLDSRNLIDMFIPIARTLGFCAIDADDNCAKESLLHYAKLCLRDKGPRIDYKLKKNTQGGVELDYPRILRSCMSFALAGVEREMIAFGVLDSLAEFMGNFVRDMTQNYAIKQVFICGDMLEHKIFFDKILLYLPRDIALILPQDGYIDTL